MFKADVNLGSAGSAGLRERIEEEGPAGVGFTWDKLLTLCLCGHEGQMWQASREGGAEQYSPL